MKQAFIFDAERGILVPRTRKIEAPRFRVCSTLAHHGLLLGSAPPTTDPNFSDVVLLAHGQGTNGGTTITDSSSYNKSNSITGTVTTDNTQVKFGSTSIKVAASSEVSWTSSHFTWGDLEDLTVEGWVWCASTDFTLFILGTNTTSRLNLYVTGGVLKTNMFGNTPEPDFGTISSSAWHHFRVCRLGDIVSVFIDGVYRGSRADKNYYSGTIGNGNIRLQSAAGVTTYFQDVRVTRMCRDPWTFAAFPTNSTDDPNWASTVLYMKMAGTNGGTTFTDEVGKTISSFGNAQTSTARSKVGTSSYLGDGTGDGLTVPHSTDFAYGSGDFTMEAWTYIVNFSTSMGFFSKRVDNATYAPFGCYTELTTGKMGVLASANGSSWGVNFFTSSPLRVAAWNHIVYQRHGNVFQAWLNGTMLGSATAAITLMTNTTAVSIGAHAADMSVSLNGNLEHVRFTKGVARYAAYETNGFIPNVAATPGYTVPTVPYPNS